MTSNVGKRLDKLHKEITELGSKGRAFHFIVGDSNETAEAKLERMKAEGSVATGDEYQLIQTQWAISQLKGADYIPEGNSHDPFEEPPLPQPDVVKTSWGEQREREQKWKDHIKKITEDGQRYGEKPKDGGWR